MLPGLVRSGGGTPGKPVGLVHFAAAARGGRLLHRAKKFGDIGRRKVRQKSVDEALAMLAVLARGMRR